MADGTDFKYIWPGFYGDWTFCEGKPAAGWELKKRDGINFHLDACKDLDRLCADSPMPEGSEGVLYARLTAPESGTVLIGFGADWNMEVYCNGSKVLDTFEKGNGRELVMPNNHRVMFQVNRGDNLIAVHVRRGSRTWNFASGCLSSSVPEPDPVVESGPWISNMDAGCATVNFGVNGKIGCGVQYRRKGEDEWVLKWDAEHCRIVRREFHSIDLTGLEPGADYEYRIVCIHPDSYMEYPLGEVQQLHIPDLESGRFSLFFTADLQFEHEMQAEYLGRMLEAADGASCDMFVLGGDINSAFLPEKVIDGPIRLLQGYGISGRNLVYVRGNHELRGEDGDRFHEYFSSMDGTTYGLFRYGDTAFLVLDSWEDKPAGTPGHPYCKWNMDDDFIREETEWLKGAMQSDKWITAGRRIVLCHGAPYSHYDSCLTIPFVLQKMTDEYFRGKDPVFRINAWLTGHVHRYLRSVPGTDEIAATQKPPKPFSGGADYCYPVFTVAGPGSCREKASCFRLDFDEEGGMLVQSWDENGTLLEKLRYSNDGSCEEIVSLEHFDLQ